MPKDEPLKYQIHDGPAAMRFQLAGSLSGRGAESLHCAWQTALSILGDRPLIMDITSVTDADDQGRRLFRLWREHRVLIHAASRESRALVEDVLGVAAAVAYADL